MNYPISPVATIVSVSSIMSGFCHALIKMLNFEVKKDHQRCSKETLSPDSNLSISFCTPQDVIKVFNSIIVLRNETLDIDLEAFMMHFETIAI